MDWTYRFKLQVTSPMDLNLELRMISPLDSWANKDLNPWHKHWESNALTTMPWNVLTGVQLVCIQHINPQGPSWLAWQEKMKYIWNNWNICRNQTPDWRSWGGWGCWGRGRWGTHSPVIYDIIYESCDVINNIIYYDILYIYIIYDIMNAIYFMILYI